MKKKQHSTTLKAKHQAANVVCTCMRISARRLNVVERPKEKEKKKERATTLHEEKKIQYTSSNNNNNNKFYSVRKEIVQYVYTLVQTVVYIQ